MKFIIGLLLGAFVELVLWPMWAVIDKVDRRLKGNTNV